MATVKGGQAAGDMSPPEKQLETNEDKQAIADAKKYVDAPPPPTNAWARRSASLHTDKAPGQTGRDGKCDYSRYF